MSHARRLLHLVDAGEAQAWPGSRAVQPYLSPSHSQACLGKLFQRVGTNPNNQQPSLLPPPSTCDLPLQAKPIAPVPLRTTGTQAPSFRPKKANPAPHL